MTFGPPSMTFEIQRSSKKTAPIQPEMTFMTFMTFFPNPHTCARAHLSSAERMYKGHKGHKVILYGENQ